jgi:hypothetical protein
MDTESESLSVTDCPDGDRSSSINDIENDKSNSNSKNCNSTNNTYEDDIDGSIDGKCENTYGTDSTDNNIDSNNNNNNNNNDSSNDNSSNNDYENTATSSSTPYRPPVTITPSYNGCSSSGYTPDSSHTASTNKTRSENEKYFPYNLSSEFSGQVPKNREFEKLFCLLELERKERCVLEWYNRLILYLATRFSLSLHGFLKYDVLHNLFSLGKYVSTHVHSVEECCGMTREKVTHCLLHFVCNARESLF